MPGIVPKVAWVTLAPKATTSRTKAGWGWLADCAPADKVAESATIAIKNFAKFGTKTP
jgi:hypothetical protein